MKKTSLPQKGKLMRKLLPIAILIPATLLFLACQKETAPAPQQAAPSPAAEKALTGKEHLEQAKLHLKEAKEKLDKEGAYDCCIEPDCDWCALKEGSCPCAKQVKAHKPVCPDCKFGWEHGKGHVEGVKAEDVTTSLEHSHGEGREPGGAGEHGKHEHKH